MAAAMLSACTQFEEDGKVTLSSASAPEITLTVTGDNSVSGTVTAGSNTCFYGYVVLAGAAEEISGDDIMSLYKSGLAYDVVDAAEKASVSVSVENLSSNSEYTLYAAATSPDGVVTEVVTKTVTTSDGTAPVLVNYDSEADATSMAFYFYFDDPVTLTGNGTATATFYPINQYDSNYDVAAYKTVDIPADCISASGNVLSISVPEEEAIPGAYVVCNFSAGIVQNALGMANAEAKTDNACNAYDGITGPYGRYSKTSLTLVPKMYGESGMEDLPEDEVVPFSSYSDFALYFSASFGETSYRVMARSSKPASVTYTDLSGRTVCYTTSMTSMYRYGFSDMVGLGLDEAPNYGAHVTIDIPAEAVVDIWGNYSSAVTLDEAFLYSYNYSLDDVVGTYSASMNSAFTGAAASLPFVIAESDDEDHDLMFTTFLGVEGKLYADFDKDAGLITVYNYGTLYEDEDGNGVCTYFYYSSVKSIDFNLTSAGNFSNTDSYVGLAAYSGNSLTYYSDSSVGNYLFYNVYATRE